MALGGRRFRREKRRGAVPENSGRRRRTAVWKEPTSKGAVWPTNKIIYFFKHDTILIVGYADGRGSKGLLRVSRTVRTTAFSRLVFIASKNFSAPPPTHAFEGSRLRSARSSSLARLRGGFTPEPDGKRAPGTDQTTTTTTTTTEER